MSEPYDLLQRTFADLIAPELPADLANVAAEFILLLDALSIQTWRPKVLERQTRALSDTVIAVRMARRLQNIVAPTIDAQRHQWDSPHTHGVHTHTVNVNAHAHLTPADIRAEYSKAMMKGLK